MMGPGMEPATSIVVVDPIIATYINTRNPVNKNQGSWAGIKDVQGHFAELLVVRHSSRLTTIIVDARAALEVVV
jgi:hypothetical protein